MSVVTGGRAVALALLAGIVGCFHGQWHPERLHEEKEHLALFELLVARASRP